MNDRYPVEKIPVNNLNNKNCFNGKRIEKAFNLF